MNWGPVFVATVTLTSRCISATYKVFLSRPPVTVTLDAGLAIEVLKLDCPLESTKPADGYVAFERSLWTVAHMSARRSRRFRAGSTSTKPLLMKCLPDCVSTQERRPLCTTAIRNGEMIA